MRTVGLAVIVLLVGLPQVAWSQDPVTAPYARLRAAYADADAGAASLAYSDGALFAELYAGFPPRFHEGRPAIETALSPVVAALGPGTDLNFRFSQRLGEVDAGIWRLRYRGANGQRDSTFGRFLTRRSGDVFALDVSTDATIADFEGLEGDVLFAADDETLDRAYYDQFLGLWTDQVGCDVVVTRSAWRLFVHDQCTNAWRGLARISGARWRSGPFVLPGASTQSRWDFDVAAGRLTLSGDGQVDRTFVRGRPLRTEAIRFSSGEFSLAGELYLPDRADAAPAMVLVHGSGPQDRHGYASIIEWMARRLSAQGWVVLTYDKRGDGESQGNWESAGFDELADDARAGMAYLATRPEVDTPRIGLGGSSQAGWVIARAIDAGAEPHAVLLLGAAGASVTVQEQNLFNTEVQMRCQGIAERDIGLALDQQRAFFAALNDPDQSRVLAEATEAAAGQESISGWLFPEVVDRTDRESWFMVLDTLYDPLPTWNRYEGQALFLFGGQDDSTPTDRVAARLGNGPNAGDRRLFVDPDSQHLGLVSNDRCKGLGDLDRFSAATVGELDRWAVRLAGQP